MHYLRGSTVTEDKASLIASVLLLGCFKMGHSGFRCLKQSECFKTLVLMQTASKGTGKSRKDIAQLREENRSTTAETSYHCL